MQTPRSFGSKGVHFTTTFSIFFFMLPFVIQAQIGLRMPQAWSPVASIKKPSTDLRFSQGDSLSQIGPYYPKSIKHSVELDSTRETVTASFKYQDTNILRPQRIPLNDYLKIRYENDTRDQWREYSILHLTKSEADQRRGGIQIETPKIKSKTFEDIFGGNTMSLNVNGEITIDGNMRNEKRSQVKTAVNRGANTNFQMKQTQRFKVTGNIGERLSIEIDQDSERAFDFENNLKIRYSSAGTSGARGGAGSAEGDGIIESIEAGNVSLSLPGTQYVTFSSNNAGLFGFKTKMKVGALDITTIASMEKGEKKKLSLEGGAEDKAYQIQDYEYKKGTYFFINNDYRTQFSILEQGEHIYTQDKIITDFELYKYSSSYVNDAEAIRAWATLEGSTVNPDTTTKEDKRSFFGSFKRLEPSTDYYLHPQLGYFMLNTYVSDGEVLAAAFRDSSGQVVGDLFIDFGDTTTNKIFKLIRPRNPQPSDETWDLEWKNVYSLGGRNIQEEGFELSLLYKPPSGDPKEALTVNGQAVGFLKIFGLDKYDKNGNATPDNIVDMDPNILSLARGELIFPELQPFNPGEENPYYEALKSNDLLTSAIYDTINDTYIRRESKFYMEVKSSSRSPNFSLGLNVIEGSEEVTLNGSRLVKDTDYVIDYFSGQLTMLNEGALDPNARLEVNYESQKLFQIDKKSIVGTRAEYTLWEKDGSRSFIGGTMLYLSQKTLDRRVRVGQDAPMNNFVWDLNTSFRFEPKIVDRVLNAAPFVHNTGKSSFAFEGELAQIIPNPNTLNNDKTGDHDGVAYLDDFEGSRRQVTLSVMFNAWHTGSMPVGKDLSTRGHMYWYNPYEQVSIQEIWPDREVTTNYGGTTRLHVLDMVFTPNKQINDPSQSWNGIQQALSTGYFNQTDNRFLELWVKGDRGRIHIDLGRVSEDAIPNGQFDTEDKLDGGFRNGLLEDDEDIGLDGVIGPDPSSPFAGHEAATISNGVATPYDFWDINRNKIKEENEPWSFDNWQYTERGVNYQYINGTENSKNATVARYPDTEDLNGNGDVDFANDYYEFSFSLDKNSPDTRYIAAGGVTHPYGWTLYRIPLTDYTSREGNPDWTSIEYIRLWVDGLDLNNLPENEKLAYIRIAEINLTGNEWKLRGVASSDSSDFVLTDSTLNVTVINTHDNPRYSAPPGVEGDIDPIQKIRTKEQALVLKLDNLMPGETAIAEKQFYEPQNLLNYKSLKMFVHGGGISNQLAEGDSVSFFLRWGSDTNNENYYEVNLPVVYSDWDERNNVEVLFEDLSRIKLQMQALALDTLAEVLSSGQVLRIVGEPSLTNVRWLIAGVKNNGRHSFSDELWLNELRLSNVRKDRGMAYRAKMDLRLGDILSFNGSIQQEDADFHTVNERFGKGTNSRSTSFNATVNVDRFMPTSWGFSVPVSATYSESNSTPKFLPGSDIEVNENTIDRNTTAGDSLWNAIQNISERKGLSVGLSKRTKSRNFLVKYLLDPVRTNFSYSKSDMSSSTTRFNTTIGYTGSAGYSLSFGTQNYWQPLKWMGQGKLIKSMAEMKFYYLPRTISFDARGNDSQKDSETRAGIVSRDTTKNYSQTFQISYNPLDAVTTSYNRTQASDMRYASWTEVLESLEPGDLTSISQGVNLGFNPSLFKWFSPNFKYSVNYQWLDNLSMKQRGTGTSCNNNISFTANGNLDFNKLMQSFKKSGKSKTQNARRNSPAPQRRQVQTPDDKVEGGSEEKLPEQDKEKKPFFALKVFSFGGNLLGRIDPVSISYTTGNGSNFYGIQGGRAPSLSYQLGLSDSIGIPISPNVTTPSTSRDNKTWSLRSGVKITDAISLKLDYSFSENENRSTQTTGSTSHSALLVGDEGIPFPNWNFNWRSLEKLPYVDKVFKSMTLTHGFSGKKSNTISDGEITAISTSKDFRPLVGLNFTLNMGINGNIQYQTTESLQEKTAFGAGKTLQTSNSLSITAKYQKKGGLKLPFMKGKLDNNIDFSLTFTNSENATKQSKDKGEMVEMSLTKNWSFKPELSYSFSRTVSGGMNFEMGKREDKRSGSTEIKAFGINARISLSGQ